MTWPTLRTDRLELRAPQPADADVITKHMNDYDVSKWLTMVPHPYGAADAEWFIAENMAGRMGAHLIWADGSFVGIVSVEDSLGYWLTRSAWGKGYATEAGHAKLAYHFEATDIDLITSSYFVGNDASCNVLTKLGFVETSEGVHFSKSRQAEVPVRNMKLTRARWESGSNG